MASITMCDRCNRLGKGTALGALSYRTNLSDARTRAISKELCPDCVRELIAWLNTRPKDVSEVPFTEPYVEPDQGDEPDERRALTRDPWPPQ